MGTNVFGIYEYLKEIKMFCTKCGKQLSDSVKFCEGCGKPVVGKITINDENTPSILDTTESTSQSENLTKKIDFKSPLKKAGIKRSVLIFIAVVLTIILVTGVIVPAISGE